MNHMKHFLSASVIGLCMVPLDASAITVAVDYSATSSALFDAGTANGLLARAAVDAAAADISAAITTQLNAVNSYTYVGVNGGTTFTYDTKYTYSNLDSGSSMDFTTALAQDEFRVFAGARSLGVAGEGGSGIGLAVGFSGSLAEGQLAADNGSVLSSTGMTRGGPILNTVSGDLGGMAYSTDFGAGAGFLSFDSDGSTIWHLNHQTAVASLTTDLYSVALHEILHSLGYGASESWDNNVTGTTWTGAEAIAVNGGSGSNLIDGGGGHVASGTTSKRLSDGVMQEVAMDPDILVGTRKELTELDLAFIRDLGYQTVPEPSSVSLLGLSALVLLARRRRI
jgi:hypothetical protein